MKWKAVMSNIPKGYKQTEVGVIPEEWEVKSLGDCFTFSGGYTASRDQLSNDGYCYLHYGDIHGANKTFIDVKREHSEIPKLNITMKNVSPKSLLNEGDVVFVDASEDDEGASKHIVVFNSEGIPFISGLHTIVSKSKNNIIDNGYKRYCFQPYYVKSQFKFYAVGTKVTGISKTNIAKIRVSLPPTKAEQTAIAAALSDADALISSLEKLIAKKRDIKQGAMQELLTGKKHLPGFSGKWEVKTLGEVCSKITTGKLDANAMKENGEYRFYTCAKSFYFIDKYAFDDEALLISGNGENVGYVHYYRGKFNAYQRTYVLTGFNSNIHYINLYLDRFLEARITAEVNAGNTPYIKMRTLTDMEIAVPIDTEEQTAIAQILSDMDAEIEELEQKLDKYRMIKQGMMEELLTGKTRLI